MVKRVVNYLGRVVNYRIGCKTQKPNELIITVNGINNRREASKLIGKIVVVKLERDKIIKGKIVNTHGNNGCVRARFCKGLPGKVLGKQVVII